MVGAHLVGMYLSRNSKVAESVRSAGARVVVFELAGREWWSEEAKANGMHDPTPFFASAQRGLDAAESSLEPAERPLHVAYVPAAQVFATRAFDMGSTTDRAKFVRLRSRRGPFLGYVAPGEGGAMFFDAAGRMAGGGPSLVEVAEALRWPWAHGTSP